MSIPATRGGTDRGSAAADRAVAGRRSVAGRLLAASRGLFGSGPVSVLVTGSRYRGDEAAELVNVGHEPPWAWSPISANPPGPEGAAAPDSGGATWLGLSGQRTRQRDA